MPNLAELARWRMTPGQGLDEQYGAPQPQPPQYNAAQPPQMMTNDMLSMPQQQTAGTWGAPPPMEQTVYGNNVATDSQQAAFNMQNGPPQPPQGPTQPGPMDMGWKQPNEQFDKAPQPWDQNANQNRGVMQKPWWMKANF